MSIFIEGQNRLCPRLAEWASAIRTLPAATLGPAVIFYALRVPSGRIAPRGDPMVQEELREQWGWSPTDPD